MGWWKNFCEGCRDTLSSAVDAVGMAIFAGASDFDKGSTLSRAASGYAGMGQLEKGLTKYGLEHKDSVLGSAVLGFSGSGPIRSGLVAREMEREEASKKKSDDLGYDDF